MSHLTLIMAFYMNPRMLAEHYRTWIAYPSELKSRLRVILVDDGSPAEEAAATVPRPDGLPPLTLYRVHEDIPWHQHAARNLGAEHAQDGWLLLTDLDHLLTATALRQVLTLIDTRPLDRKAVFTFGRVTAPKMHAYHPHPNSYLLQRRIYWKAGGYDESLIGVYGTDGLFRSQLRPVAHLTHRADIRLVRYPREVIADASTRTLDRKTPEARAKRDWAIRHRRTIAPLQFAWSKVDLR